MAIKAKIKGTFEITINNKGMDFKNKDDRDTCEMQIIGELLDISNNDDNAYITFYQKGDVILEEGEE